MKKTEINNLRSKTYPELNLLLADKRQELSKLIVEKGTKKLKNVARIGSIKHDIAIILTIIKEEELNQS